MALSMQDSESYWRDGYLLIRSLFDAAALDRFETRFVDIATGRVPPPERMTVMRDVMIARGAVEPKTPLHAVNKILSFENDPVLFDYTLHAELLEIVESLIPGDLMTISTNVFNKPPGVDGRHPLHQDLRYFTMRPADRIIASWTAISPCRRQNGCLVVVPGSHLSGLREHGTPDWDYVNSGYFSAEGVDPATRQHVEMEPGDTLLFHPLLIHGSGRNRSSDFRRAISTHYASVNCESPDGPRKRKRMIRRLPRVGS